jgi:hypothetical protein
MLLSLTVTRSTSSEMRCLYVYNVYVLLLMYEYGHTGQKRRTLIAPPRRLRNWSVDLAPSSPGR